uniref:Uncharacterized protein n=1 Tax=Cacopsylla melanoneura TaxID=428564 RepID=A0A8D8VVR9_9HEMI
MVYLLVHILHTVIPTHVVTVVLNNMALIFSGDFEIYKICKSEHSRRFASLCFLENCQTLNSDLWKLIPARYHIIVSRYVSVVSLWNYLHRSIRTPKLSDNTKLPKDLRTH